MVFDSPQHLADEKSQVIQASISWAGMISDKLGVLLLSKHTDQEAVYMLGYVSPLSTACRKLSS
jgi:hypothetical protein